MKDSLVLVLQWVAWLICWFVLVVILVELVGPIGLPIAGVGFCFLQMLWSDHDDE